MLPAGPSPPEAWFTSAGALQPTRTADVVARRAVLLLLASIPSPGFNSIGPFRLYGIMIALGVLAAIGLGRRRWAERGGDPADISSLATWCVPAGLIGTRLWHVMTDWQQYFGAGGDPAQVFNIREGGLGIPGGVLLGGLVGWWRIRRQKLSMTELMDVAAPAVPLAQAIGRLGNWFNQELYGRPTSLPWGLEIDGQDVLFHPTFLYEALWNLALVGVLLALDRTRKIRPGNLWWLYVAGYGLGRLWIEELRIDPASLLLGLRVNIWTSLAAIGGGGGIFLYRQLRWDGHRPDLAGAPDAPDDDRTAVGTPEQQL